MSSSKVKVVLGLGCVGDASDHLAKFNDAGSAQEYMNVFRKYGHVDMDTARGYSPHAPGTSEPIVGQTDFASWAIMDTKVTSVGPHCHSAEGIAKSIEGSLEALRVPKLHIDYLHMPDRTTPFEDTCKAMTDAIRAGKIEKFGISNFRADQLEEMLNICEQKGYIKPGVYQGHYNAVARIAEEELFPLLRKHNIQFYAYSPAAGGAFSKSSSRFNYDSMIGKLHRQKYGPPAVEQAIARLQSEAEKAGITGHEVALRWILHHSALSGEHGDGIVIAASSLKQLEGTLEACDAGPLPDDLVKLVEEVWGPAKATAPSYHPLPNLPKK